MASKPTLEAVRRLIKQGIRVFPVARKTKRPLVKWQSEYVSSIEELDAMRKRFPNCNWGINCGKSNLTVIDLDVTAGKKGPENWEAFLVEHGLTFKPSFVVRTHSGGLHLYYWGATLSSPSKLGPGIDIKSVGGFVVAPGSVGKYGQYVIEHDRPIADLPEDFIPIANKPGKKDPNQHIDTVELDQEHNIMWASEYLNTDAPIAIEYQGGNDTTYKVACWVRDLGVSEEMSVYLMDALWNKRCKPPWDLAELETIVGNAYRYSQNPSGTKAVDAHFSPITEIDTSLPGILTPEKKAELKRQEDDLYDYSSIIMSGDAFQRYKFPDKEVILDPWVQVPSYTLITGGRGVGKTWFALSLLFAIAAGKNFGPWNTEKSVPVLYFEAEMAGADQQERIAQLCNGQPSPKNFHFLSGAMLQAEGKKPFSLNDDKCRNALTKVLVDNGIRLFVLDNIASTSPGIDENDKAAWDNVNQWCLELRHRDASPILIHHHNKMGQQRGTSGREDNTDLQVSLAQPKGYHIEEGANFDVIFNKTRQFRRTQLERMVGYRFQLNETMEGSAEWSWTQPKRDARFEVMLMLAQGMSNAEINVTTGVAKTTISGILAYGKKQGWFGQGGHLTDAGKLFFEPYLNHVDEDEEEDDILK